MKALTKAERPDGRRATIYDVAKAASVSVATVSRSLHGKTAISDSKRRRIAAAIKKLGFRPHPLAQSLALPTRGAIGLIVARGTRAYADLFLADVLSGIAIEALTRQIAVHLTMVDPAEPKMQLLSRYPDVVDGSLIMDTALEHPAIRELIEGGHPAVLLNKSHDSMIHVSVDNRRGGDLAARHLLDLGHRDIACLTAATEISDERVRGYRKALARKNLRPIAIVNCEFHQREARRATRQLLQARRPPTAILTVSDWMAAGVLKEAAALGVSVPRDLSVIGFDDAIIAESTAPSLTTVRQPLMEMGRRALEQLMAMVNKSDATAESVLIQPLLVERETTAPPRAAASA